MPWTIFSGSKDLSCMSAEVTARPMVSVSIITFNQIKYIGQAVESALEQVTDFPFEIVISDDGSDDGTRELCKKFARQHPDKIRMIARPKNLGVTGNYLETYKACSGKYVAFLEGDDFWLNPRKLQIQVEFLERNPDYAICCHNVYMADENGVLGATLLDSTKDTTTVEDLCTGDYISTPSCMMRNGLIGDPPDWLYEFPACDWPFDILNAEHGKIKFLPEPMAAYRLHNASAWSSLTPLKQSLVAIDLALKMNRHLAYRYDRQFSGYVKDNAQRLYQRAEELRGLQPSIERNFGPLLRSIPGRALRSAKFRTRVALNRFVARPIKRASRLTQYLQASVLPMRDLVVVDDAYPHPQSAFRREEFDTYLREFPRSAIYTTGTAFSFFKDSPPVETLVRDVIRSNAAFANRVVKLEGNPSVRAALGYSVFAGNASHHLPFFERNNIPFVFTLYPGGMLQLDDADSDQRLKRIFASPMFRRVITTQRMTSDYIISKNLVPADKVEFVYGVVTPQESLREAGTVAPDRKRYGFGKKTLDICFVAHKYMKNGRDKGYDVFLDVARKLIEAAPECRFHVVGGFGPDDIPIDGLEHCITFYGGRSPDWFSDFYKDKDAILLPNVPFVLLKGAFDGFPTGCGSDAMLHGVALFCTDPLSQNSEFEDRKDLVIVQSDIDDCVAKLLWYRMRPAELKNVGESGQKAAARVYSYECQMAPRLEILRREMAASSK
jgi:glycosyltransferase involved in cell wall biosynthesis